MTGISIKLQSITRNLPNQPASSSTSGAAAESKKVTYYRGDPEFDTYEREMKERIPTEITLPKNFLGPGAICSTGDATKLNQPIFEVMRQYHSGYASTEDVEKALSHVVSDIRSTYTELGFDPETFTGQLVEDVYDVARMANVSGASVASWYEGRPIAQAHNGHLNNTWNWVYYNADHYYASEEMKGTLQDITRKIGAKYGAADLDLPTDFPDGDIRKGIYSSYNTAISDRVRNDCRIGNILDETMAPPAGLKFFYRANEGGSDPFVSQIPLTYPDPYATFDSFLSISYGDWSFTGRVPVRMDATQFPISVNMFDAVSRSSPNGVPKEISAFLKNFDFFTTVQSGPYMASHPRKY